MWCALSSKNRVEVKQPGTPGEEVCVHFHPSLQCVGRFSGDPCMVQRKTKGTTLLVIIYKAAQNVLQCLTGMFGAG